MGSRGTDTYVTTRKGSANFYARVLVPDDVRAAVKRAEIWESLRTPDLKEARRRSQPIFAKHFAHFEALRRTRPAIADDLHQAAFDHYATEIEVDRRSRLPLPADAGDQVTKIISAELDAADSAQPAHWPKRARDGWRFDEPLSSEKAHDVKQEQRLRRRQILAKALSTGDLRSVEWAADFFIAKERLDIERGSAAYSDLCQRLMRAELEALRRAGERDDGDWGGIPADPVVKPSAASQKPLAAKPGETIPELFEAFYRERAGSVRDDTWEQNRMVVGLFADYVGRAAHVSAINRRSISGWKQQLMMWPRQAANTREFAGLGFKEIIAKNATVKKPPISDKTINRYLSGLGKFCLWLLANDHLESDVMRGQYLGLDKSKKTVRPYSDTQLASIFASPIFTGCKNDNREHLPGEHRICDWRYWVPILALYSGARLGELCQLMTGDIRQLGDTWVMHVTTEGEGDKQVKTTGSQRVVPLHPKVIDLGFLAFHAECLSLKKTRLFPELARDTRGQFGGPSRFFARYLTRIGVKADKSQNFHSFRHGIADAFRRAGYRDEEFAPLLGHVRGTTTARYGLLREGELSSLKKMIDAVDFAGIIFSK